MQMNIRAIAVCLMGNVFASTAVQAAVLNIPIYDTQNTFLFIENQTDNNVFIAPNKALDPRMTGSNAWNSLKGAKQKSLAYVDNGYNDYAHGYNVDMWETGPIRRPYTNQRCVLGFLYCDSNGVGAQPAAIDNQGMYGMKMLYNYFHANISSNFFNYLKNMQVGDTLVRQMHICATLLPYDAARGERCINQASGYYKVNTVSQQKVGHLKFIPTNAISEVIVDSNGNPYLLPGSRGCQNYVRGHLSGILCDFLNYNFTHGGEFFDFLHVFTNIKDATLNAAITTYDVQMTSDMINWGLHINGLATTTGNKVSAMKNGSSVKVFLSNNFFKQVVRLGLQDRLTRDLLNFNMSNWFAPESGYYEFSGTTEIAIKPREFSVSILPSEGITTPYREGKIGKDILSFPYNIMDSGPTSADSLNISVAQDSGTPYQGHCTFYPTGQITAEKAVPVPIRLVFDSYQKGDNYKHPIRCDSSPVDIRPLGIKDSQPILHFTDPNGDITVTRFRKLALEFDLTDPMAQRTTTGDLWEGSAGQSGTITINGIWR